MLEVGNGIALAVSMILFAVRSFATAVVPVAAHAGDDDNPLRKWHGRWNFARLAADEAAETGGQVFRIVRSRKSGLSEEFAGNVFCALKRFFPIRHHNPPTPPSCVGTECSDE